MFLKEANFDDIEKEYDLIKNIPEYENGFTNPDCGCTPEEFKNDVLPRYINYSKGIGLKEGYVPSTEFFLWDGDRIAGLFRIRHFLNQSLANGAGHIGYSIRKEFRGKGYATEGLRLTVEKAKQIIKEDEIYLSVHKDNPASLKVQLKNGAYIHHQDEKEYYTRIKL